ncbi:hypothetical protein D3C71_1427940 [compost metagenome]
MGQFLGLAALPGRHVLEDRFLVEVEANHVAYVGVDRLVVGHAGADSIRQDHIARAVSSNQTWHAEHGVRVERQRIEIGIVESAVNDIHLFRAGGGAHIDTIIADKQVGAFHQLHAHFTGQERVFEVGTVEAARGQHHGCGVVQRAGALEGVQQQVRVMIDGRHALGGEEFWEQTHHHLAVFEHVADAAGRTQVVFQYVIATVAVTDQIDPGDMGINATVQIQALHGDLITLVSQDLFGRDDALLEDALAVVDVGQEHIQGLDPLNAATLNHLPFAGLDAARNDVERNQPLGALLVPV